MISKDIIKLLSMYGLLFANCSCLAIDWYYKTELANGTWIAKLSSRPDYETVYGPNGRYSWPSAADIRAIPKDTKDVVSIPSSIDGYPVRAIEGGAFGYCTNITGVVIPDSVSTIGSGAFEYCWKMQSVRIPSNIGRIDNGAFASCGISSIALPTNITSIGNDAFHWCSHLNSITIPSKVKWIGKYAFEGCTNLTSVTIPSSVTTIGDSAFASCSNLVSVHISNLAAWCRINFGDVKSNPLRYSNGFYLDGQLVTNIQIPSEIKEIMPYVFCGYQGSIAVTIPSSVTTIGESAFYNCSGLTNVTIPNSVTRIGNYAFYNCSGLTNMTIPNSVTNIGYCMFQGCSGLTSITIPDGVVSIGESAFNGCSSLTSVTIPSSVTNIGLYAFYGGCLQLQKVFLPTTYQGYTSNRIPSFTQIIRYVPNQTITFDAAGGTLAETTKTVRFNAPYGALPVPVREGYGFVGWRLNGEAIASDTVVRELDNHTLTALWTKNNYTLSFDANGGTGDMDNVSLAYDVAVSLPQNAFSRRNYVFVGWSTNATDEVALYEDCATISNMVSAANATLTLHAVWSPPCLRTVRSSLPINAWSRCLAPLKVQPSTILQMALHRAHRRQTSIQDRLRYQGKSPYLLWRSSRM